MKKRITTSLSILTFALFYSVTLFGQTESKVAVITVSGSGKTQEGAKQNALRNAIEQAFGTFISSNTQILNDELVKDEIVSVSNGNIQEYTVISEVQTPDGWSNTVKAKVAIDKLTSFCESKGVDVEFKGALFTLNVKQQILNEENEVKSISNLCKVLKDVSEKSFDYEISAADPVSLGNNNTWKIPITIKAISNANFKIISDYLAGTLRGLSLTSEEVANYIKLQKDYHAIVFCPLGYQQKLVGKKTKKNEVNINSPMLIYLRKEESVTALSDLIAYFRKTILNFAVINDLKTIQGEDLLTNYVLQLDGKPFMPVYLDNYKDILSQNSYNLTMYKPPVAPYGPFEGTTQIEMKKVFSANTGAPYDNKYFPFLLELDPNSYFGKYSIVDLVLSFWLFNPGYLAAILTFDDILTLDQLNKISGYKIIPRIGGSAIDQEGKLFKTVYVGNQRWMAQDLNVIHFSNGDPIQGINYGEPEKWSSTRDAAYTSMESGSKYKLYNWYTLADNRNVCPSGWHVPSEAEWGILIDFLGGKEIAGGKLKGIKNERGYDYWKVPNIGATNEFFFTSIATDVRDGWGNFSINWLENCFYWMNSGLNSSNAGKSIIISFDTVELEIGQANAHAGLAIRCIKD